MQASKQTSMQVSGHGSFSYLCSAGYLLVAVKIASSIFVNRLNATNLKSSKSQFQFQFELSLAQFSPSLFVFNVILLGDDSAGKQTK